ncbi:hypothetical protein BH09PAT1_BH09PAT1_5680 [soil metagenome]
MDDSTPVIPEFIRNNGVVIAIGAVGLLLIVIGLWSVLKPKDDGVIIEKADSSTQKTESLSISPTPTKKIVIDVEGAVTKPGIYSLASDSREQDAITAAGGLSIKADEAAIAKGMNMAARLSDGMKLYIPFIGEQPVTSTGDASVAGASTGSISINSASSSQLDSLPGIGAVTAGKIISNRPYNSVEELLSKKAVTKSVFEKIKDLVTL